MNKQKYFSFKFKNDYNEFDFYVNSTNKNAFDSINKNNYQYLLLIGPNKSGKTSLSKLWLDLNKGVLFYNNFEKLLKNFDNILIDNLEKYSEEEIFHLINHCQLNNLKILITSRKNINEINFKLKDLISRLKSFSYCSINNPDDDMLLNILTKLFIEKQFIINSNDIFKFILKRANRSYEDMIFIVEKLDNLSLEKKRQLTIPLIKEIL